MAKIHVLPPDIVSKIAAGEVIERPASVVKELLENALDAGATDIEIRVADAGRSLIQVRDNGCGISRDDIEQLFHRHATSKIATQDDLYAIHSLGFRGEALYSIAAVADVVLRSRTADNDTGWEIHCRGSQRILLKPVSKLVGTEIEIKELFFNTPARRKFLKSDTTEFNHILDIVTPYALLYADRRFVLTHNNREIFDLPPAGSRVARASQVLRIPKEHLIHFEDDNDRKAVAFELLLGDSNIQRPRKDEQYLFVNARPVQNRAISFHMNEAYKLLFPQGCFPFFCVMLNVPASDIDVNVHPTKREVKIQNEQAIAMRIRGACERALMTSSKIKQSSSALFPLPEPQAADEPTAQERSGREPAGADAVRESSFQPYRTSLTPREHRILFDSKIDVLTKQQSIIAQSLGDASYIGVFMNKYLLFESGDSLLIIDQHAAHERITFEKLIRQIRANAFEIDRLLTPMLLKATPKELLSWEDMQKNLEKIGFSTTSWDKETIALHSYPRLIRNPEQALRSILSGEEGNRADPEYLARRACRSSVMTGERLHKEEADTIRKDLLACDTPFTCPHGRPTVIEVKEAALNKQFLR